MYGNTQSDLSEVEAINVPQDGICCKNCGATDVEAGYELALCKRCRDGFVDRPIPLWIKGTLLLVLFISIFALTNFSTSLTAGIAYERGMRAEQAKKMRTATEHYLDAAELYPESIPIFERLSIAAYEADQIDVFIYGFSSLIDKEISDEKAFNLLSSYGDAIGTFFFPEDELKELVERYAEVGPEEKLAPFQQYLQDHPNDYAMMIILASVYDDLDRLEEALELMETVNLIYPHFVEVQYFLASLYRRLDDYPRAAYYSEQALKTNVESAGGYVSLSKVRLAEHQDQEGLALAKQAYQLDNQLTYVVANMALAYHYNGMITERDQMVAELQGMEDYDAADYTYLFDTFTGQYQWRDEVVN